MLLTPSDAEEVRLDEADAFFKVHPDELEDATAQRGTLVAVPTLPFIHAVLDAFDRYAAVAETLWPESAAQAVGSFPTRAAHLREALAKDDGSAKTSWRAALLVRTLDFDSAWRAA